jgi:hypothetical protein
MSKAEEYLKSKKAFGMMFLRGILNQLDREKISMSRALELMNMQASDFSAQENKELIDGLTKILWNDKCGNFIKVAKCKTLIYEITPKQ